MEAARAEYYRTIQPEEHPQAAYWVIRAPSGQVYEINNLLDWLRSHSDMLDGTVHQAWDGISKIKYSMQGKREKNPSKSWKGWTLLAYGDKRDIGYSHPSTPNRLG